MTATRSMPAASHSPFSPAVRIGIRRVLVVVQVHRQQRNGLGERDGGGGVESSHRNAGVVFGAERRGEYQGKKEG